MRKNSFSRPGGVYEPTNQPRLGFFCDLEAKLTFVSDLIFCKNLYFLFFSLSEFFICKVGFGLVDEISVNDATYYRLSEQGKSLMENLNLVVPVVK